MKDFGTVRTCPKCRRGNVSIAHVISWGPAVEMVWNEETEKYEFVPVVKNPETFYNLECGHTVTKSDAEDMEVPKFVRWYPQEIE